MRLTERLGLTYMQFLENVFHAKSPVINHCHEMHVRLTQYISPFFFYKTFYKTD